MPPDRTQFSVLLISEDERMQRMTSWILLEEGYYVAVSATAAEAEREGLSQPPDVVLVDARDRLMDDEVTSLRGAFPKARFLVMHFHGSSGAPYHIGAECHLHTPFHADDLLQSMTDVLNAELGAPSGHSHV
jgi:DNA-binding response OmpR family regulator